MRRALERSEKSIEETLSGSNAEAEEYSERERAEKRGRRQNVKYARDLFIRAAGVARTVGRAYKAVKGVNTAGTAEVASEDEKRREGGT